MESTTARLADRIATLMLTKNISQVRLAEATGIPRVTLIRRLNGQVAFTLDELDRISVVLETPISQLIGDAA